MDPATSHAFIRTVCSHRVSRFQRSGPRAAFHFGGGGGRFYVDQNKTLCKRYVPVEARSYSKFFGNDVVLALCCKSGAPASFEPQGMQRPSRTASLQVLSHHQDPRRYADDCFCSSALLCASRCSVFLRGCMCVVSIQLTSRELMTISPAKVRNTIASIAAPRN